MPLARAIRNPLLLVLVLALAACGDDGDGGDDGNGDPEPNTVRVGPGGALRFDPATLTVPAGTTVTWRFASSGHNVVSGEDCTADLAFCSPDDAGCASAGPSANGATYTHTFDTPGTYPYFCSLSNHCEAGMTGTIVVE